MTESKKAKKDKILKDFKEKNKNQVDIEEASKIISGQVPDYRVIISDRDHVEAQIYNGVQGSIVYDPGGDRSKLETIARFIGSIGPVVKMGDGFKIQFNVNNHNEILEPTEAANFIANLLGLSPGEKKKLISTLNSMAQNFKDSGNYEERNFSHIEISQDNQILVKYPQKNNEEILKVLHDFYDKAPNPDAYLVSIGFLPTSLLHYHFKKRSRAVIQVPSIMFTGTSKATKTSLISFLIFKGFDMQDTSDFVYEYERIRTQASFNNHLTESYYPMLLDDTNPQWVYQHEEQLKGYGQSAVFASRGNRSGVGVVEFHGYRSLFITMNDNYREDHSIATSNRFIIVKFGLENKIRKNKIEWQKFKQALPDGFILSLIKEIFDGVNFNDLLKSIEEFENSEDWVNFGLSLLNKLCKKYNIPEFPYFHQSNVFDSDSYAYEVAESFISENEKIQDSIQGRTVGSEYIQMQTYRSPIENQFLVEDKDGRTFIYFTSGAYKLINQQRSLKMPYSTAADFINNIKSTEEGVRVENNGQSIMKRVNKNLKHCYAISIPNISENQEEHSDNSEIQKLLKLKKETEELGLPIDLIEQKIKEIQNPPKIPKNPGTLDPGNDNNNNGKQEPETGDGKKDEKTDNEGTGDNPSGNSPDPNKSAENETYKKEENKEHKSENPPDPQKLPKIPKNPKMCYYKIMDHFDAYPDSYFDGSDIIMDSYRPIYHKNSANISYILLKVLIPENLSKQPGNWMKFLVDSQEISQKAFETLSRGDSQ